MSFGTSIGDCVLLAQLAWNTFQGAKSACGEHNELTREVSSLYKVLNRLQKEVASPNSFVSRANGDRREELEEHVSGCEKILKVMDSVLKKYNSMGGRRPKQLWQKVRFGNGEVKDLADIRIKLSAHTSAIMMSLNLCSLDTLGRVEETLEKLEARSSRQGSQLNGIRKSLHWVTANMTAAGGSGSGSVWTSYTNDDKTFWRELRRELVDEGYDSSVLQKYKRLIKAYIEELGNRGVFDDQDSDESQYIHTPRLRSESRIDLTHILNGESSKYCDQRHLTHRKPVDSAVHIKEVASVEGDSTSSRLLNGTMDAPGIAASGGENSIDILTMPVSLSEDSDESKGAGKLRSLYAARVEEVIDEAFALDSDRNSTELLLEPLADDVARSSKQKREGEKATVHGRLATKFESRASGKIKPYPVQVEDIVDDDFLVGAHPNIFTESPESRIMPAMVSVEQEKSVESSLPSLLPIETSPLEQVQSTELETNSVSLQGVPLKDLRFIFYREFRDFDTYQELQESYQAHFDEKLAEDSTSVPFPTESSTFITHSPYTPPATMWNLSHYRIPASYFHKFWHPQRVPIYLHGNVFDGVSLSNWIYNWTAYHYGGDNLEMSTVQLLGATISKLGLALTDIEHANPTVKASLPKDLYDQSGILWANLENIINDVMCEAEDRVEKLTDKLRLEVEFVRGLFYEIIVCPYHRQEIDEFKKSTEAWCKTVRFHPDFILLWEAWES